MRGLDQRRSKLEVGQISASRTVVTGQGSVGGDDSSTGDGEGGCWVERLKRKTWAVVNGSVKNGLESSGEIVMMAMVHARLDAGTRKFSNLPLEGHCSSTNYVI